MSDILRLVAPDLPVQSTTAIENYVRANISDTAYAATWNGSTLVPTQNAVYNKIQALGSGTVTDVSVVAANGVSGTVATSTTTPAITLVLGAITPSSVAATGNVSAGGTLSATGTVAGSNLSGTNTGDQFTSISNLRILGNNSGALGAATALTGAQATTILSAMVGDTGTGGTKGLVPAPAAGDATKFLSGAGTFVAGGTVTTVSVVTANGVSGTVATATTTPAITLTLGAITPTTVAATGAVTSTGAITSSSASGGTGYATGSGGTVTQATSKATAVTLNRVTGEITTNAASLAAATIVSFTLNNSVIVATDQIVVTHHATGTFGAYTVNAHATGAGTASIAIRNNTAGALAEAIVLKFAVTRAPNA